MWAISHLRAETSKVSDPHCLIFSTLEVDGSLLMVRTDDRPLYIYLAFNEVVSPVEKVYQIVTILVAD